MNKRTAIKAAIGAAAAVAGSLVVAPTAALAVYTCGAGQVCLYQDYNYKGSVSVVTEMGSGGPGYVADFRGHRYTNGVDLNDSASFVVNNTNQSIRLYEHGNFNNYKSGDWFDVAPNSQRNAPSHVNDKASSISWSPDPY
ncbi:peptidase inhibitor family I36 protein [Actinoplanes derwentensis]|uniref:Peptidase inhibitor family I36 n=1 Tax=Actinoplanes derwentensis TaxID=113562 RepID=A0A1H2CUC0_9ACTN|nr:peptidase inhibitor family I36 protein [Actinoplanes derwentensis]GID81872.1 hypothetical protein Ade03nite_07960 [Actinoplanes derwentensis]SDT73919.1 hypothetical protein SAMN04489716_6820 [Actinoplanes derwentensis]